MHAQIHDQISMFLFSPGGLVLKSCFRGSERTGYGSSGFLRSDGGLPPEFSRFLSYSLRADSGISVVGRLWTLLQSVLGRGGESRKRFSSSENCSLAAERGQDIARFSLAAMKRFSKDSHRPAPD